MTAITQDITWRLLVGRWAATTRKLEVGRQTTQPISDELGRELDLMRIEMCELELIDTTRYIY